MTEKGSDCMNSIGVAIVVGLMMWIHHINNSMKSYRIQQLEKQIEHLTK